MINITKILNALVRTNCCNSFCWVRSRPDFRRSRSSEPLLVSSDQTDKMDDWEEEVGQFSLVHPCVFAVDLQPDSDWFTGNHAFLHPRQQH